MAVDRVEAHAAASRRADPPRGPGLVIITYTILEGSFLCPQKPIQIIKAPIVNFLGLRRRSVGFWGLGFSLFDFGFGV